MYAFFPSIKAPKHEGLKQETKISRKQQQNFVNRFQFGVIRATEVRDSENRDSASRDSEARDPERGQIHGPLNSDTP